MRNLEELNSECFSYENYEAGWWDRLQLSFSEFIELF